MGARPPSDSTDGDIQTFIVYIYDCNHGINVYMVDRFIGYIFISGFICQVLYVQIEHQDLSIYSQILSLLIYHSVTFSYIYIIHYIGLFILCKYVSHAT